MCLHKFVAGCRGMARRRVIQLQSPWLLAYYCTGEGRGKRTKQVFRCSPLSSFMYEPKLSDKILLPEAVPPNLTDHGIEAWIESPYLALVHLKHHPEEGGVGRYGGLAAAHPCTWCAIGCAVDALAVGVAAGHIWAHGTFVAAYEP
uniref:Uncharacterized protein n=1 Tax=Leersia perrieri TaxID=77586 RepID=A0A0D9Y1F2_9ORYZ